MVILLEKFAEVQLGQIVGCCTVVIVFLSTFLEFSKIKVNPWSWIARKIGRAVNGEVLEEVVRLKEEIDKLRDAEDERNAKLARIRILHFGDELLHEVRHSKEHFDEILQAITEYNKYCDDHPNFKNHMTEATTSHILNTYEKCMEEHSFL